jgi:hypothetical protein
MKPQAVAATEIGDQPLHQTTNSTAIHDICLLFKLATPVLARIIHVNFVSRVSPLAFRV